MAKKRYYSLGKGRWPFFLTRRRAGRRKIRARNLPRAKVLWIGQSGNIKLAFQEKQAGLLVWKLRCFSFFYSSPLEASDLAAEVGIEHKLRMKVDLVGNRMLQFPMILKDSRYYLWYTGAGTGSCHTNFQSNNVWRTKDVRKNALLWYHL